MERRKKFTDVFDDDFEVTYEEDDTDDYSSEDDRYYDEDQDSYYDERPRASSRRRSRRAVPLAAPIRKGGRALSKAAAALIRCLTAVLILATTAYVTYIFWRASAPYGDISEAVRTKELTVTLAAYLSVAAVFILFQFIALLWSMTRTRIRTEYGSWKEDTGRGLGSFIIVFAASYLSFLFCRFLPETPEVLYGLKGALDVYGSMHNVLLGLCVAGVISCLARKYC